MSKMKFGEWIGAVIAGNSGGQVMQIGSDYFNMDSIKNAAAAIDGVVWYCQMEGRKLNPLESLMVEILLSQAGFKTLAKANTSYQRYLNKKDEE